jgi:radical SAM protein with 4Fe4S-binding SPASM domain
MDVVNQCNLRCVMCHFSAEAYYRRKKHEISVEDFERIAEQVFPLCAQVSLSIGTEPLLHSRIGELVAIAASYRIPWIYMHTNGLLLTERLIEQLIDARFNQLSISIDAATRDTYEKIRVGGQFEKLITNIRAVGQARLRRGTATPHVCFNVVLMRSNITELPAIVQLAHDLGVSGVAAVHMMHFREAMVDPERESLRHHKDLCNRMLEEAGALAARLGMPTQLPERFATSSAALGSVRTESRHRDLMYLPREDKRPSAPGCPFPQHFVGIDADGSVFPCGWWHGETPMGNIRTESFEQIWTTTYARLRAEHRNGVLRTICETCPTAGTGSVNNPKAFETRQITYLPIATSPPGPARRPASRATPGT